MKVFPRNDQSPSVMEIMSFAYMPNEMSNEG